MTDDAKPPSLARNLISIIGAIIAVIALANIIFLVVADATGAHNPYVGIFAYAVVPGIMIFGIVVFIAGILLERRRRHRMAPDAIPRYPDLDLNQPNVRRATITLVASALQHAGYIRYARGHVTILDHPGLEAIACECYERVRETYQRLIG